MRPWLPIVSSSKLLGQQSCTTVPGFYWKLSVWSQVLFLHSKHFIDWAIFPTPLLFPFSFILHGLNYLPFFIPVSYKNKALVIMKRSLGNFCIQNRGGGVTDTVNNTKMLHKAQHLWFSKDSTGKSPDHI